MAFLKFWTKCMFAFVHVCTCLSFITKFSFIYCREMILLMVTLKLIERVKPPKPLHRRCKRRFCVLLFFQLFIPFVFVPFFFQVSFSKTRMLSFILLLLKLWSLCQVAALLLLSQQEERHLLERNVNAALQKKIEELQRNLFQVISWFDYTQLLEILQQHLMT